MKDYENIYTNLDLNEIDCKNSLTIGRVDGDSIRWLISLMSINF